MTDWSAFLAEHDGSEERIRMLLGSWGYVSPEMLFEYPEEARARLLEAYALANRMTEPVILQGQTLVLPGSADSGSAPMSAPPTSSATPVIRVTSITSSFSSDPVDQGADREIGGKASRADQYLAEGQDIAGSQLVELPANGKNELLPLVVTHEEATHGSTGITLELPWVSRNLSVWLSGGKSAGEVVTLAGKGPLDPCGKSTDLRCELRVIGWTLPGVKTWSSWRGGLRGDLSIGEGRLIIVKPGRTCSREAVLMLSKVASARIAYSWHRGNHVEVYYQLNRHQESALKLEIMAGAHNEAVLDRLQREMKGGRAK